MPFFASFASFADKINLVGLPNVTPNRATSHESSRHRLTRHASHTSTVQVCFGRMTLRPLWSEP
jgi:hypothetical protein